MEIPCIADFSANIYAGYNISQAAVTSTYASKPVATGFSAGFTPVTIGDGLWGLNSQGVTFTGVGNLSYTLNGGVDYSAAGGMKAELSNIITSYGEFANKDEIQVDYLIMGPGCTNKADSQAKIDAAWSAAQEAGYDLQQLLVGGNPFGS